MIVFLDGDIGNHPTYKLHIVFVLLPLLQGGVELIFLEYNDLAALQAYFS